MTDSTPVNAAAAGLTKEEAISETIRQVEFYFADANLPFDKFLWTLTRKSDGWVPIATLASFKRMKPMRDVLTDEEMLQAIKSSTSGLLEVDDKENRVRRAKELVKQTDSFDKSIYAVSNITRGRSLERWKDERNGERQSALEAKQESRLERKKTTGCTNDRTEDPRAKAPASLNKGFTTNETPELQPALEKFFAQFGPIASVRFRRQDPSKVASDPSTSTSSERKPEAKPEGVAKVHRGKWPFKGSVFVEFQNKSDQEAFLSTSVSEPDSIKYGDTTLEILSKKDYCDKKIVEKGILPGEAFNSNLGKDGDKKTKGRSNLSGRNTFNAFKELEKEANIPGYSATGSSSSKPADEKKRKREEELEELKKKPLEFEFNGASLVTNEEGKVDPDSVLNPEKTVLAFKGVGDVKGEGSGDWRTLKDELNKHLKVKFVEFIEGSKDGKVAFNETVEDEKLKEIVDLNIKLGGEVLQWERVQGEAAKTFYVDRANFRAKFMLDKRLEEFGGSSSGGSGGRGRGGRGGGGRGRGGSRGRGDRGGRGRGGRGRGEKRSRDDNRGNGIPEVGAKKMKTE